MKRPKLTIDDMKAFEEKLLYDIKFAYVRTGHAKNELLGFLTVFNARRSLNVKVKRQVHYDMDGDRKLYLNIYERKDRDPGIKAPRLCLHPRRRMDRRAPGDQGSLQHPHRGSGLFCRQPLLRALSLLPSPPAHTEHL